MKKLPLYKLFLSFLFINSCGVPPFDSGIPDTENNKYHYEHLINIKITPDVKNLYTRGDQGSDASFYIAFECNEKTAKRIISSNKMRPDPEKGPGLYSEFSIQWWDKDEIISLPRYVWKNDTETYFKYFWYNKSNQHAYFLDFDL